MAKGRELLSQHGRRETASVVISGTQYSVLKYSCLDSAGIPGVEYKIATSIDYINGLPGRSFQLCSTPVCTVILDQCMLTFTFRT